MRVVGWLRRVVSLVAVFPSVVAAQGTVAGTITDTSGAAVRRATVVVEGTALRALSNDRGEYVLDRVPAGTHTLRVQLLGYVAAPERVAVRDGETTRQDFALRPVPASLAPVAVVGSRARHAAADELAVPVDVFTPEELRSTGTTETSQILAQLAPSVNFPRQSVSDASEIVRPFTMRGLSPDHTLVLLNGRRRHHTALIHYYGAGMGAGSSGVDMNALPVSAVERLEVLRDGAAAQYGSDAIAGVVNLVLRSGAFDPEISVDVGRYMPTDWPDDGETINASGAWGIPLGRGSLGLFVEYRDREPTNRAGPDPEDQITPGDADDIVDNRIVQKNNPVVQPNHHWGDGAQEDLMAFANLALPLGAAGDAALYAFGGWSFREGTGFGYYRQALSGRNWPQIYPRGFLPTFSPDVTDVSAAGGIRGGAGGWIYDFGATLGYNAFEFGLSNTLNTSLGPCLDTPCAPGEDGVLGTADDPGIPNQTSFDAGELRYGEGSLNLDLNRRVDIGLPSALSVAVGLAARRETYEIIPGERASWIQGWHPDQYGDIAPSGSQVFPGFRPEDAADESRTNVGAYIDLESDIATNLLANIAGRFENYSDFGSAITGKLALRFQPTPLWTFRGAVSTGFRAPSLNQSFYSSTVTNFKPDPTDPSKPLAFEIGIFPVASREARALGARELEEETSRNLSAGFAFTPVPSLSFTADYYYIDIDERIMLTTFLGTDSVAAILRNIGSRAEAGQYFTNAIDTRTQGVDVTANYSAPVAFSGMLDLTAVFNYTVNDIVGDIPLPPELEGTGAVLFDEFGEGGLLALEKERPKWRGSLTAQYGVGAWRFLGRGSFYGPFTSALYGYCADCAQEYAAESVFDAEIGYTLGNATLTLGGRNLFDTFPEEMRDENSFGLFLYPSASPFGFNGRFVYVRITARLGR